MFHFRVYWNFTEIWPTMPAEPHHSSPCFVRRGTIDQASGLENLQSRSIRDGEPFLTHTVILWTPDLRTAQGEDSCH